MSTDFQLLTAMRHKIGVIRRELGQWHEDLRRQREINQVLGRISVELRN